ncbi:RdgB/HAM1 family non-canonical purine NTP pyrophosphatase [Paenibacillus sp. JX-17]|uniref:dITP/XTP pyrophosphatase n=1 Tax=Paenibacillus lacisoli TaxID=3064525 RepID=A0ABT9CE77_9BACL|nr:RdgB/HAM1 family non-canonical purine NTP pyrophosphatase [Paenibacillus sp. JX-17]MDO7906924.1 RdgB/HAM1 family non-canonical purine NTP pyrophosphatase [Paenibacillus sp. JX-17]
MKMDSPVVIVATKNKGKVREFAHAFAALGKEVKSMYDYEGLPEIIEDGDTFAANAMKKAKAVGDALQLPVLADDSGLCVQLLDGAPGVYSARYAGEGASDDENNLKLLDVLESKLAGEDTEQPLLSPAHFECALVLYDPVSGESVEASGRVEGWITAESGGSGGFGYDPLFYLPEYSKTMAELSLEQKQAISHRGKALRALIAKLNR